MMMEIISVRMPFIMDAIKTRVFTAIVSMSDVLDVGLCVMPIEIERVGVVQKKVGE